MQREGASTTVRVEAPGTAVQLGSKRKAAVSREGSASDARQGGAQPRKRQKHAEEDSQQRAVESEASVPR
jgi:hypothetical protein